MRLCFSIVFTIVPIAGPVFCTERQLVFRCCPRFDGKLCTLFIVKSEKKVGLSSLATTNNASVQNLCQLFRVSFFFFDEQMMNSRRPNFFLIATINHTQITKPKEVAYWLPPHSKPLHSPSAARTLTLFPSQSRGFINNFYSQVDTFPAF